MRRNALQAGKASAKIRRVNIPLANQGGTVSRQPAGSPCKLLKNFLGGLQGLF